MGCFKNILKKVEMEFLNNGFFFSINGMNIKQEKINTGSIKLNIEDLSKGIYLLELRNEEGVESRKFLVE